MSAGVLVIILSFALAFVLIAVPLVGARRPSAVELDVDGDALQVRLSGRDALYSLQRTIKMPWTAITRVAVVPNADVARTGLRLPGTEIPGVLRAGSYGRGSTRDFWLVRRAAELLVIELAPGSAYRKLVLEVPEPQAALARLLPHAPSVTDSA